MSATTTITITPDAAGGYSVTVRRGDSVFSDWLPDWRRARGCADVIAEQLEQAGEDAEVKDIDVARSGV